MYQTSYQEETLSYVQESPQTSFSGHCISSANYMAEANAVADGTGTFIVDAVGTFLKNKYVWLSLDLNDGMDPIRILGKIDAPIGKNRFRFKTRFMFPDYEKRLRQSIAAAA
jgi:hypothetical protein